MNTAIESCRQARLTASRIFCDVLTKADGLSEAAVADLIKNGLDATNDFLPSGWYDPPPHGIAVLFGDPSDNYQRVRFDSLRKQEYWPNSDHIFGKEGVGMVYASPISPEGIIGDWSATIYSGQNPTIKRHLAKCLQTIELLAGFAQVGMEFGDISRYVDELLTRQQLACAQILITNRQNVTGINCGHTVPWTDQPPTASEQSVLDSKNQDAINQLISDKRVFINANETMTIPQTIAFTIELRLASPDNPQLPNGYFHLIVCFEQGKKTILSNFNDVFQAVGMDYLHPKYG